MNTTKKEKDDWKWNDKTPWEMTLRYIKTKKETKNEIKYTGK